MSDIIIVLMADSVQALEVEEPDPLAYASEQRREEGGNQPRAKTATFVNPTPSPGVLLLPPPMTRGSGRRLGDSG